MAQISLHRNDFGLRMRDNHFVAGQACGDFRDNGSRLLTRDSHSVDRDSPRASSELKRSIQSNARYVKTAAVRRIFLRIKKFPAPVGLECTFHTPNLHSVFTSLRLARLLDEGINPLRSARQERKCRPNRNQLLRPALYQVLN